MSHEPRYRAAKLWPVPGRRNHIGLSTFRCLLLATPLLGGCSMSFPMSSMLPANDDVTGSISDVPFGALLDGEDRRREKAAIATALDPQGDGATIHWENPKTSHHGSITPVGHAYTADTQVCRAFIGDLAHEKGQRSIQATACIIAAGQWAVKDVKPFRKA